jgi:hypothetical protein
MSDLRASDTEREQAVDRLRRAAGEGRLTVDELDARLHEAYGSVTREQLDRLLADLPEDGARLPATAGAARTLVQPGSGGETSLVAVFGGVERRGRWRLGERCSVTCVFGGADLDLTQAELSGRRTELRVISVFGGADVSLPEGLNVDVTERAIFGGNDVRLDERSPDPGGPVLHLRLTSVFGGTAVRRGRRPTRAERRALRRGGGGD